MNILEITSPCNMLISIYFMSGAYKQDKIGKYPPTTNAEAYMPWIWKRQGIHTMYTIPMHIINVILPCILMF
jgi:hypothetical protein